MPRASRQPITAAPEIHSPEEDALIAALRRQADDVRPFPPSVRAADERLLEEDAAARRERAVTNAERELLSVLLIRTMQREGEKTRHLLRHSVALEAHIMGKTLHKRWRRGPDGALLASFGLAAVLGWTLAGVFWVQAGGVQALGKMVAMIGN